MDDADASRRAAWERYRSSQCTSADVLEYYTDYSQYYDEFHTKNKYRGPMATAEVVLKYVKPQPGVRIIDMAAGSGLSGEHLKKAGFDDIDAMDPSKEMRDKALAKNIYKNYFLDALTEKPTQIPKDTYACVVMVGGVAGAVIPPRAMLEIIRITKPGGFFINTTSKCHFDDAPKLGYRLEPYMEELAERGKWRLVEKRELLEYHAVYCPSGILHVFEIIESGVSDFESSVL